MSINTIANAEKYASELDKVLVQKSVTGFLADNTLKAQFVGAKTVKIPNIDFVGLVDYDRDNGFNRAAVTIAHEPFTMSMDRARSIQIDREDMDETGIANLAGSILGEYVRAKVAPECDAYILSKLAGVANTHNNTVDWDATKPFAVFNELMTKVQNVAGHDEELVAFVDGNAYAALMNSPELSRYITASDFKKGEVDMKVKSINGVALIPVTPDRMKTAFNFKGEAGGFTPDGSAKEIHMLVLPKKAASLVKKTEKMRVFSPEQNLDADAYKFDYRVYYDVFVKKSYIDTICGSFGA